MKRMILGAALLAAAHGCYDDPEDTAQQLVPPDCADRVQEQPTKVDLLVLVDNSNSMAEEQAALSAAFGPALRELTDPPDADGDGVPDHPALVDLRVGVIDSDMGTGGFFVQTCSEPGHGDGGILRSSGNTDLVVGCSEQYPRFLTWQGGDDPEAFSHDFECLATLGTGGCGFEQQLGAVRHALTIQAAPGSPNEGFVREDSLLAILIVTDEDDCTVAVGGEDLFDTQVDLGPLNLRCHRHPDRVEPVDSLVDDLIALRAGHPERLLVAGIVGAPVGSSALVPDMTDADFAALLDDPAMQEVIDESDEGKGERLVPSCDVAATGTAFPPRRIVQTLRAIDAAGGAGMVQSICQSDWTSVMAAVITQLRARFGC